MGIIHYEVKRVCGCVFHHTYDEVCGMGPYQGGFNSEYIEFCPEHKVQHTTSQINALRLKIDQLEADLLHDKEDLQEKWIRAKCGEYYEHCIEIASDIAKCMPKCRVSRGMIYITEKTGDVQFPISDLYHAAHLGLEHEGAFSILGQGLGHIPRWFAEKYKDTQSQSQWWWSSEVQDA